MRRGYEMKKVSFFAVAAVLATCSMCAPTSVPSDSADVSCRPYFRIARNGTVGIAATNGTILVPMGKYRQVYPLHEGYFWGIQTTNVFNGDYDHHGEYEARLLSPSGSPLTDACFQSDADCIFPGFPPDKGRVIDGVWQMRCGARLDGTVCNVILFGNGSFQKVEAEKPFRACAFDFERNGDGTLTLHDSDPGSPLNGTTYDDAKPITGRHMEIYWAVSKSGKWGLLGEGSRRLQIPFRYDRIAYVPNGLGGVYSMCESTLIAERDNLLCVVDIETGRELLATEDKIRQQFWTGEGDIISVVPKADYKTSGSHAYYQCSGTNRIFLCNHGEIREIGSNTGVSRHKGFICLEDVKDNRYAVLSPDGKKHVWQGKGDSYYISEKGAFVMVEKRGRPILLISESGTFPLDAKCEHVVTARPSETGAVAVLSKGKWGLIDKNGRWALPPEFDAIGFIENDIASVEIAGKWGLRRLYATKISKFKKWLVEPTYSKIEPFINGLAVVEMDGKKGALNLQGRIAIPIVYDDIRPTYAKAGYGWPLGCHFYIQACKNGKWGLSDADGNMAVPCRYEGIDDILFHDAFIAKIKGKWGVFSVDGSEIIPADYDFINLIW